MNAHHVIINYTQNFARGRYIIFRLVNQSKKKEFFIKLHRHFAAVRRNLNILCMCNGYAHRNGNESVATVRLRRSTQANTIIKTAHTHKIEQSKKHTFIDQTKNNNKNKQQWHPIRSLPVCIIWIRRRLVLRPCQMCKKTQTYLYFIVFDFFFFFVSLRQFDCLLGTHIQNATHTHTRNIVAFRLSESDRLSLAA